MPMPHSFDLQFHVDESRCIACGVCVEDCVAEVLVIQDGKAAMSAEGRFECIGCQHCFAVCPVGAVSVMGLNPDAAISATEPAVDPDALDLFVRRRRSIRKFSREPVPPELLDRILSGVGYAPTGVNSLMRHFTVIRDPEVMNRFREKCADVLVAKGSALEPEWQWLADAAEDVLKGGRDAMFRGAPHIICATVPQEAPCGREDCLIALSYFDILAQANGVGTTWAGIAYWMISSVPEIRAILGIPEDHVIGYALLFGMPAISYPRTVQRTIENVRFIDAI
ncbi:nitroreductase family protein [Desulfosarcina sp. OttesenSCG-928-B08]|nr:nitroreductase family protein [Desulfosarcina sp. OttesenSCG-928-B08]